MLLSVIIPARNEAESIEATLRALLPFLPMESAEVIVVNDHSTDATAAVVSRFAASHPIVRCVSNTGEPGFASALRAGFREARGRYVLPVMADGCDDPSTIPMMLARAADGYDLVAGCRYMRGGGKRGGPLLQGLFSTLVCRTLPVLTGLPTRDVSNAFKLYRREPLVRLRLKENGFAFSMEATLAFFSAGLRIADVPTIWTGREKGASKFRLRRTLPYVRLYLAALRRGLWLRRRSVR